MGGARRSLTPKAPSLPPVSSKAKDYSMDRPSEVQNELDQLRNRGLAKALNRHFTETTKQLAKEKASADAALADLERRRANTKEFVPSKGGELSPFDSMYVQLQQKRAECRRKERETMLLYQRYVTKYGKKTKIIVPNPTFSPTASEDLSPSSNSLASSLPEAPPPPSPAPTSVSGALQPLDENTESVVSADVTFSRHHDKKWEGKRPEDPPTKVEQVEAPSAKSEETKPKINQEAFPVSSSNDPPEHGHIVVSDDESIHDDVQENAEIHSDPPAVKFADESHPEPRDTIEDDPRPGAIDAQAITEKTDSTQAPQNSIEKKQAVVNSSADRHDLGSDASDANRPALEVTTELPSAMEDSILDDDDRSIISGLTMNSQVTRLVLDEIEQEINQFLKTETEVVRKILDEEERTLGSGLQQSTSSLLGDESKRASAKAEEMAREMERILNEYAADDTTIPGEAASPEETAVSKNKAKGSSSPYPKPYVTDDPAEDWVIYYDESYEREYYFEKNSKRTQWEPPNSGLANSQVTTDYSSSSPVKTRRSRTEIYRRRLRKRRIRRAIWSAVVLGFSAVLVLNWQYNHPNKSLTGSVVASLENMKVKISSFFDESNASLKDRDQSEARRAEERAKLEAEAKAREIEEAAKNEEVERKAKAAREAAEIEKVRLAAQKAEEESRRQEEEMQAAREAESKAADKEAERQRHADEEKALLRRPWGCNLPLAYIHPKCNLLAKLNPMYGETDLINSFMQ